MRVAGIEVLIAVNYEKERITSIMESNKPPAKFITTFECAACSIISIKMLAPDVVFQCPRCHKPMNVVQSFVSNK